MQKRRYLVSLHLLNYVRNICNKNFEKYHWLQKCEVTDTAMFVIVDHLKILSADLKERFSDLKNKLIFQLG